MMVCGLVITIFLMSFVLPRFARIYEQRAAALPAPTRLLLAVSDFVTTQYLWYLPAMVVVTIIAFVWIRLPSGRRALDFLRLNLPVLRTMYRHLYITRFTRTMATLLAAGVNVLDTIEICRGVTGNVYYDELWDTMEEGVRGGGQISEAVAQNPLVGADVASMMSAGERSGKLSVVMEKIADFSAEELDGAISTVTSFIEPLMIVCMGAAIGGVALALLLPIFSLGKIMAGG